MEQKKGSETGVGKEVNMAKVIECMVSECAYNNKNKCHAIAITVGGDEPCPVCDTTFFSDKKGGLNNVKSGVGACKVEKCEYNNSLECSAKGIHVKKHEDHAECATFKSM